MNDRAMHSELEKHIEKVRTITSTFKYREEYIYIYLAFYINICLRENSVLTHIRTFIIPPNMATINGN